MRGHNHVKGGTNAGWRNPFEGAAMPWQCRCEIEIGPGPHPSRGCTWPTCYCDNVCPARKVRKTNIGALVKCPDCGTERPS